jgi:hypothetical protein
MPDMETDTRISPVEGVRPTPVELVGPDASLHAQKNGPMAASARARQCLEARERELTRNWLPNVDTIPRPQSVSR